jgi:PTH2 family peptidyl-tRNA hydrolase
MIKQVIVIRKDLCMSRGKMIAQSAHVAHKMLHKELTAEETEWLVNGAATIVLGIDSEQELKQLIAKAKAAGLTTHTIIDAGKTEFKGVSTLTCAGFGPHRAELIDPITGHLKLL